MTYTDMLRTLSVAELTSILRSCGRQAREGFFARHQIRAPKVAQAALTQDKTRARAQKLHAVLANTNDDPLCEELLRQWFLAHRPLLRAALDALGIPHEDGLTDDPKLTTFATLSDADRDALIQKLTDAKLEGSAHAGIYVHFMQAQMKAHLAGDGAVAASP